MAADFRAAAADPRRLATGDDERELFFELSRMSHPFKGNPKVQEVQEPKSLNRKGPTLVLALLALGCCCCWLLQ